MAVFVLSAAVAAQPGEPPATEAHDAAAEEHAEGEHGGLSDLIWPTVNFIILCGGLYYFLGTPFTEYLSGRSSQIRKDLLEAAELNRKATGQLADVDHKMKALPAEIDTLRTRGAEEIAAEDARIASAAASDRERLLTQTRREIEVRLRAAERELSEHAADLSVKLARERLSSDMTAADHARLVDRYIQQVEER
jgi:F-type H+-transporting ATPase subunit b